MADADETRHTPDGQVRVRNDEDDNSDDDHSEALPRLGDIDYYAHNNQDEGPWLRVGVPVIGAFLDVDHNAPAVPLAAVRVNPPRAGEQWVHHLMTRYGLAVGNLSLAQTQRVIFERRIWDLEFLELRRPTRARDHIVAQELRYTENEAQLWRILRRLVGHQHRAAITTLLDLKLECTLNTPPLRGPRNTTVYPYFEWVPTGTVGHIHAFRQEDPGNRLLRWRILSIERELIGADAGPVPVLYNSVEIRAAISEVTQCTCLPMENIRTWEIARARLRTQLRSANHDISTEYNSLYRCHWDPLYYITEIP
jgi:hypothetical protein